MWNKIRIYLSELWSGKEAWAFWPAVYSCQHSITEGEEFGEDDGEHGLTTAMAVTQGELQQIQQALWEADGRQQAEV